jgi:hypothetical protein
LNLKSVNRVFIIEPQWNPAVESQAIARAIRLGQTEQVLVIRYRVKGSIEEVSYFPYQCQSVVAKFSIEHVRATNAKAENQQDGFQTGLFNHPVR